MDTFTLSTEEWYQIEKTLPIPKKRRDGPGRPVCNFQDVFKGIVWVLTSGARWKDLPCEFPSYQTCHRRFQQWGKNDSFVKILKNMARKKTNIDLSETYTDGSFILSKRGGDLIGKSFKGRGCKIAVLLDRKGMVHSICLDAANRHDIAMVLPCLAERFTYRKPKRIVGDKAYDSNPMDKKLRAKGIELIAPDRECKLQKTQDKRKLRRIKRRWSIERFFARIKNYRRVAIRWERKSQNYLNMVRLATILTMFTGF